MESGIVAFRVKLNKPKRAQPPARLLTDGQVVHAHTRRAHTKSRGGCLACKQGRKKCDEQKPKCGRCLDKDLVCQYTRPNQRSQASRELPVAVIERPKWPGVRAPAVLLAPTSDGSPQHTDIDLKLINHFVRYMGPSIAGPEYNSIAAVQAVEIAKDVPYLMHAMLALAASHLQQITTDGHKYRNPASLHTQLACQGLRTAISHMISAKSMDSVLTTSMILNSVAFCYSDYNDFELDMTYSKPSWQWLRVGIGLKDLLYQTRPFHEESIWMPMFVATSCFVMTAPAENDLDVRLARYCGITEESNEENCTYYAFFNELAPLVTRSPSVEYVRRYTNAIGGVSQKFVDLLEEEDDKAMALFGHWLALICHCLPPYMKKRATRACWRICFLLDQKLIGEERILLGRPARACGYIFNESGLDNLDFNRVVSDEVCIPGCEDSVVNV